MRRVVLLAAIVATVPSQVHADELVGRATVVDGDTLGIRDQKIRLHGIDAPEASQRCTHPNGQQWRCGQQAANALSEKIGQRNVRCEGKKRDRWGRLIAVCYLGNQDLNAWLVRRGLAVAYRKYSKDYIGQEERARKVKAGVWSGTFEMPWDWRKARRSKDQAPRDGAVMRATGAYGHISAPWSVTTKCPAKANNYVHPKRGRLVRVQPIAWRWP